MAAHPRDLDTFTATVEEVTGVEWDDDVLIIKLDTGTDPEGYSVPTTLRIDESLWAHLQNLAGRALVSEEAYRAKLAQNMADAAKDTSVPNVTEVE